MNYTFSVPAKAKAPCDKSLPVSPIIANFQHHIQRYFGEVLQ